jgi:hypothetical protein
MDGFKVLKFFVFGQKKQIYLFFNENGLIITNFNCKIEYYPVSLSKLDKNLQKIYHNLETIYNANKKDQDWQNKNSD